MDATDLVRRLWKCRYAGAAVVLLAGLVASWAWINAGVSEQSSAAVVIVPPPLGDEVSQQNPLLNLDNNLAQLATVLAAAMASPEATAELAAADATAPYTISTVTGTNPSFAQLSPQIVFTVTAPSAGLAERTSTALVYAAQDRLEALQADAKVPDEAKASLVTVVSPTAAEPAGSGRLRSAGAVGVGAAVLGLLVVLLLDEVLTRRRARRSPAPQPRADAVPFRAPDPPARDDADPATPTTSEPAVAPGATDAAPPRSPHPRSATSLQGSNGARSVRDARHPRA